MGGRPRVVSSYEATATVNRTREGRLSKAAEGGRGRNCVFGALVWLVGDGTGPRSSPWSGSWIVTPVLVRSLVGAAVGLWVARRSRRCSFWQLLTAASSRTGSVRSASPSMWLPSCRLRLVVVRFGGLLIFLSSYCDTGVFW